MTMEDLYLYVHSEKITQGMLDHLQASNCTDTFTCVTLDELKDSVYQLGLWASGLNPSSRVLLARPTIFLTGASYAIYEAVSEELSHLELSPIIYPKAEKNEVSINQG